jgi:low affinity Fe/Cu permease
MGMSLADLFHRIAKRFTEWAGRPVATILAFAAVLAWFAGGIAKFGFGSDYQMYINTGTTIVTFLMVFLIQNTQNRDAKVIHLKLDELIKGVKGARDSLVDLEDMTDADLDALQAEFKKLREQHARLHPENPP